MTIASARLLPQHREMKSTVEYVLVVSLVAFTAAAVAQSPDAVTAHSAPHQAAQRHPLKSGGKAVHKSNAPAGEAVSLERTEDAEKSDELHEDNRGRITTAHLQHRPPQLSSAVQHAKQKSPARPQVKTVSRHNHAARPTSPQARLPETSPVTPLKEHNARMF
jgi:hypothetical protein